MPEEIITFTKENNPPFYIQMAGISYCDPDYRIKRDHSPIHCLEYVAKGSGTIIENGKSYTASAGQVYLLHRQADHFYYTDPNNPWTKLWMNVSGELSDQLIRIYGLDRQCLYNGAPAEPLFREFLELAKQKKPKNEIFYQCSGIFLSIVQQVSQTLAPNHPISGTAEKLKTELDNQAGSSLSLEALAKTVYCTKAHAIRVFKSAYGVTPYEYLLRRKIELSKIMLENTACSISEIAEQLGFCDPHYFSGFFKKRVGVSPAQYRKERR